MQLPTHVIRGRAPTAVPRRRPNPDLKCAGGGELTCTPIGDNKWDCMCKRCKKSEGVITCISYRPSVEPDKTSWLPLTAPKRRRRRVARARARANPARRMTTQQSGRSIPAQKASPPKFETIPAKQTMCTRACTKGCVSYDPDNGICDECLPGWYLQLNGLCVPAEP